MKRFGFRMLCLWLSFVLLVCYSFSLLATVYAADNTTLQTDLEKSTATNLDKIPIFITYINQAINLESQEVKDNINDYLDTQVAQRSAMATSTTDQLSTIDIIGDSEPLSTVTTDYSINEISPDHMNDLLQHPIYKHSLIRANELMMNGVNINYINIFTNETSSFSPRSITSNSDSEEYWESECEYFATRNNYKFLYTETAYSVSTNWVTPGNISPSINWVSFIGKTIVTVATVVTGGNSKAVDIATSVISELLGSVTTPLAVTYGDADESEFKTSISGHIYTRTIFIQDILDRFDGYAYYYIGGVDQARVYQLINGMMPTSRRTSTTYNYTPFQGQSNVMTYNTPGFIPSREICDTFIDYYRATGAYLTYEETIDPNSMVTSLLS